MSGLAAGVATFVSHVCMDLQDKASTCSDWNVIRQRYCVGVVEIWPVLLQTMRTDTVAALWQTKTWSTLSVI